MRIRKIVLPGELVAEKEGRKVGDGAYFEGEKVYAKVLGIPMIRENEISVIPLLGTYLPRVGDMVIGVIKEVEISGWLVDINSPYVAFLSLAGIRKFVDISKVDLSRYYDVNDVIYCRISNVTKNKIVRVSMKEIGCKKLLHGTVVKITPSKVPRVIGRSGSMIKLLRSRTGCEIVVGQNGVVWTRGTNVAKAVEAILTIERESHVYGLTDKIERMLSE